jgi:uncharacterized protein
MASGTWVLRAGAIVATVLLLVLTLAWTFQRRLIYLPSTVPAPPATTVLPGGEDVAFDTADGLRLRGWFIPARDRPADKTVLVFNGNAADRSARAPLADALARAGLSVLLFDYRGYAGNPGHPSEEGLAADARAARAYVLSRADTSPGSLVYLGESLGGAVAIGLAAQHPPAALVLRSPFTTLADVGQLHYPYLPVRALLKDRYDSIGGILAVRCPLLVVAGSADTIVPPALSRQLYDAAREPKRYVEIPGADHNDWELLAGRRFVHEIVEFVLSG